MAVIVASMYFRRRGSANPSRLDLRAGNRSSSAPKTGKARQSSFLHPGRRKSPRESVGSKQLNIIFNFNGQSWDAYEVLGLPAGSSRSAVEEAFLQLKKKAAGGEFALIEAAYREIIKN